jgi:hypothetical protein
MVVQLCTETRQEENNWQIKSARKKKEQETFHPLIHIEQKIVLQQGGDSHLNVLDHKQNYILQTFWTVYLNNKVAWQQFMHQYTAFQYFCHYMRASSY